MRVRAKHVWAGIALGVVAFNASAEDGDLLSEQVDQWLITHPVLTRSVITLLAVHLANAIKPEFDVVSLGFTAVRKVSNHRPHPAMQSSAGGRRYK